MELRASDFSGERFSVTYQLTGSATDARARAEQLCLEQTVETTDDIIPEGPIRDFLLGQVARFHRLNEQLYEALLTFPVELLDESLESLLHVAYGSTSLRPGVRVADIQLPETGLSRWTGPRFGVEGLRTMLKVFDRPLVCAVLKPLGLSARQLADLAYEFALGGVDIVKDDQGLADHPFCPFEERVSRCVEAVARATRQTGSTCLYAPHLTGSWPRLLARAGYASCAGAGALLLCPGIVGFDQLAEIARQASLPLPILSHPALLGTYYVTPDSGIAPHILFGLIPRLAGADVSIYPTFGLTYPMSQEECRSIALTCRTPMRAIRTTFPTAAGRMGPARIPEMAAVYGRDLVYVLGSGIRTHKSGIREGCREFTRELSRS